MTDNDKIVTNEEHNQAGKYAVVWDGKNSFVSEYHLGLTSTR